MSERIVGAIDRVLRPIENVLGVVVMFILALLAIITTYMVIARYWLPFRAAWAVELSAYFLIFIAFLPASLILRERGHIEIDIVYDRVGPRTKFVLDLLASTVAAVASLVTAYYAINMVLDNIARNIVITQVLQVPRWILISGLAVGFLLLGLRFVRDVVFVIANRPRSWGWSRRFGRIREKIQ